MAHSSHFLLVLLWAVSLFHVPALAEYGETNHKCKDLLQRREWYDLLIELASFRLLTVCDRRKLNNTEKANYIKAVKCLQARPPLHQNIAAVRTRFDEFQALHINVADRVHTTVNFATAFINAGGI
jgi:tyrosinase